MFDDIQHETHCHPYFFAWQHHTEIRSFMQITFNVN